MILRFFKGSGTGVIFLISATLLLVWFSAFLNPNADSFARYETDPMPLYGLLKLAIGKNPFPGVIFSFFLVSLVAIFIINFNNTIFLINERTFLPALIYILCGGIFPEYQNLNPVIPASFFLMLAIKRIMDGYHNPGIAYNFFDAGILISIGSLFYANLIWFGLLVLIGIALIRTGSLMEIVISVIGLLTPFLIAFGVYYIGGKDMDSLLLLIKYNLFGRSEDYLFQRITQVALVFMGVILIVSIAYLFRRMNSKKIKTRKAFSLLLWVFIISLVIYFVLPSASVEVVWITSIPVCYFLSHYFVSIRRKLVPEIVFSLFLILVFMIQILNFR
jgi:hypothetical protein